DHQRARFEQPPLAFLTHPGEQNLPRISLPIRVSPQGTTRCYLWRSHLMIIAPMNAGFRFPANHNVKEKRATPLCYPSSEQIGCMRANCVRWLCGALLVALLSLGAPMELCGQQPPASSDSAPEQNPVAVTEFRVVTAEGQVLRVSGNPIAIE